MTIGRRSLKNCSCQLLRVTCRVIIISKIVILKCQLLNCRPHCQSVSHSVSNKQHRIICTSIKKFKSIQRKKKKMIFCLLFLSMCQHLYSQYVIQIMYVLNLISHIYRPFGSCCHKYLVLSTEHKGMTREMKPFNLPSRNITMITACWCSSASVSPCPPCRSP